MRGKILRYYNDAYICVYIYIYIHVCIYMYAYMFLSILITGLPLDKRGTTRRKWETIDQQQGINQNTSACRRLIFDIH